MFYPIRHPLTQHLAAQSFQIDEWCSVHQLPPNSPYVACESPVFDVTKRRYIHIRNDLTEWLDQNAVDWHVDVLAPIDPLQDENGIWHLVGTSSNIGLMIVIPNLDDAVLFKTTWL